MAPVFSFPRKLEQFGMPPAQEKPQQLRRMEPPNQRAAIDEKITRPVFKPPSPKRPEAAPAGDPALLQTGKPRQLSVSVTPGEYETLGLIAVKKSVTRHQLVRNALDEYLALLVDEFGEGCQCIYTGCSCGKKA
jgi:hypothetical protein